MITLEQTPIDLHTVNTQDFNDMRSLLTQIEQALLGVDPTRQSRFYASLHNRLYEMLQDAQGAETTNLLLYPEAVNICLN